MTCVGRPSGPLFRVVRGARIAGRRTGASARVRFSAPLGPLRIISIHWSRVVLLFDHLLERTNALPGVANDQNFL